MGDRSAIHIWITRPQADADALAAQLSAQGMIPWVMPALEIIPYPAADTAQAILMQADKILVTSRHAVTQAVAQGLSLPTDAEWFAVGQATADALMPYHIYAQLPERQDSEGLLALSNLARIADEDVLIMKGVGGRPVLAQVLAERGAKVTELALYQRRCCFFSEAKVDAFLQAEGSHLMIVASGETLDCLWQGLTHTQAAKLVEKTQLMVISERIAHRASALGWSLAQIQVAKSASLSGLIETIHLLS